MVTPPRISAWLAVVLAALLGACATPDDPGRPVSAEQGRALVGRLLPEHVKDRAGWAIDIYAAITVLGIDPTPQNVCAVVAVTDQESGFSVDPAVPGLAAIAQKEIERLRTRAGIPKLVLDAALALPSSDGASYADRIAKVRTERELSDLFDDFVGRVPLGKSFLAERNPVRTGGPMQVSIAYAQAHAEGGGYPYPIAGSIRDEVFTRRGGMYFGIAHLLDYPASYDRMLYRFADFNAGHHASRNAAFQHAVTQVSGIPLVLDGDLLRYDDGRPLAEPGSTELAVRSLGARIDMNARDIRRDLELGPRAGFEKTASYRRVFALADRASGKPLPRAVVPKIQLKSPKITRALTTEWFASRVEARYQQCLRRSGAAG